MKAILIFIILIMSVSCTGQTLHWAKNFGPSSAGGINIEGICTDQNNNIYVTGSYSGIVDFDPGINVLNVTSNNYSQDIFIKKLDSNGQLLWIKSIGGIDNDFGSDIVIDTINMSIYVTGYYEGIVDFNPDLPVDNLYGNISKDGFILSLDFNGQFNWVKGVNSSYAAQSYEAAVDLNGNIYVVGEFFDTLKLDLTNNFDDIISLGSYDSFILKFDNNGSMIWSKSIGGLMTDQIFSISVDANGNLIFGGRFQNSCNFDINASNFTLNGQNAIDAFIMSCDNNGNFLWCKQIAGSNAELVYDIKTSDNYLYATGWYTGTADFDPSIQQANLVSNGFYSTFVLKWDLLGNYIWAYQFLGDNFGHSINIDSEENIYIAGYFQNNTDFDPLSGIYSIAPSGMEDAYLAKIDSVGNLMWNTSFGGSIENRSNNVAIDDDDNVILGGYFQSTTDFDPSANTFYLSPHYFNDAFIVKLGSEALNIFEKPEVSEIKIFPNPASNGINFVASYKEIGKTYSIKNMLGLTIKSSIIQTLDNFINLDDFYPGIYYLEIDDNNFPFIVLK